MVNFGSEIFPPTQTLTFNGKKIILHLQADGSYMDEEGTIYPPILWDPGFAGIEPLETGKGDPFWNAAKSHDAAFSKMKLGYQNSEKDNLKTFGNFVVDIGTGMLTGAYMLGMGIPYILVGGIGGMIRWAWLKNKP